MPRARHNELQRCALAYNIRTLRRGSQTQQQLAALAALDPDTIGRAEAGGYLTSGQSIASIAYALGCGVARLFEIPRPIEACREAGEVATLAQPGNAGINGDCALGHDRGAQYVASVLDAHIQNTIAYEGDYHATILRAAHDVPCTPASLVDAIINPDTTLRRARLMRLGITHVPDSADAFRYQWCFGGGMLFPRLVWTVSLQSGEATWPEHAFQYSLVPGDDGLVFRNAGCWFFTPGKQKQHVNAHFGVTFGLRSHVGGAAHPGVVAAIEQDWFRYIFSALFQATFDGALATATRQPERWSSWRRVVYGLRALP